MLASLAAFARRVQGGGKSKDAAGAFPEVCAKLRGIASSTEDEFLGAGARLMPLQRQAQTIAAGATSLAEVLERGVGPLGVLAEVVKQAAGSDAGELAGWIEEIERESRQIQRAIQAIAPIVRSFDVMGVLTRIESSRFAGGGASFEGLAASVGALSLEIREKVAATSDSAAVLLAGTTRAANDMRRLTGEQRQQLAALTHRTHAELEKIRAHHVQVTESGTRMAERFGRVSAAIGEVVSGLQAHDIVRQQIEHIVAALEGASKASAAGTALLQAAQLEHSTATFRDSVHQVRAALQEVERTMQEVSNESLAILGHGSGDHSFLATVEAGVKEIVTILEDHSTADHALAEAAAEVYQRTAEIARTVAGVYTISIEMQRIALNSTIQAARLGQEGSALEAVAGAIRSLADQTEEASNGLQSRLEKVQGVVEALNEAAGLRAGAGAGERIDRLRDAAAALAEAEEQANNRLDQTVAYIESLAAEIHQAVESFGTHEESIQAMQDSIDRLRAAAGDAKAVDLAAAQPAAYTMQSEWAVHRAVAGGDAPSEPEAVGAAQDNVEFF